jgi:uncharacterized protein (TIGR02453 family)
MAYFNRAFIHFFKGLAANNHKDWFDANRKTYEKEVKKPFYQLVADTIAEVSKYDKNVARLEVKNAVFRINRDIRFSEDKTPYKLHVSAAISPEGRKGMEYPGMYLHLNLETCHIGGGCYMPSKENLGAIRRYIVTQPKEVESALNNTEFVSVFSGLQPGEKNKILPKEFKEFGDNHPLLFNKQFYYMADYPGEETILRDDLLPFIMKHYKAAEVWNDVLKKAMK